MTTQEVLEKYFKDERILYFNSSDALSCIEGETYLRYAKQGKIQIWFGGNSGEVCLLCTSDPMSIENIIKAVVYG